MTEKEAILTAERIYKRAWRAKNRDKVNAREREWRRNNPEKVREIRRRYWLKKAKALNLIS